MKNPESGNYQNMHSGPVLPNYLGLPFQILVSPFVRFDPVARVTDIMMFNSKNLGALIVQEEPHVQAWEDAYLGIQNMSIEETYTPPPQIRLGLSLSTKHKTLARAREEQPTLLGYAFPLGSCSSAYVLESFVRSPPPACKESPGSAGLKAVGVTVIGTGKMV